MALQSKDLLIELGFNPKILGFKYILQALDYLKNDFMISCTMSNKVYPYIAELNNVSVVSVRKSIKFAIDGAWKKQGTELRSKLFDVCLGNYAPSNSEFLGIVAKHLYWENLK